MPSDTFLKVSNRFHHGLIALSGGRLGWRVAKMPVLRLTTTGRRSGEPRTVMLTSPHQVGDAFVIVASRGGDDRHPSWFLNLQAEPKVRVQTGDRPPHPRVARVATADERAEWWPMVVERHAGYGRYQERTGRQIPLVVLETFAVSAIEIPEGSTTTVVPITGGAAVLTQALRALDAAAVDVRDVMRRRPTLDDAFLSLAGVAGRAGDVISSVSSGR